MPTRIIDIVAETLGRRKGKPTEVVRSELESEVLPLLKHPENLTTSLPEAVYAGLMRHAEINPDEFVRWALEGAQSDLPKRRLTPA